MKSVDYEAFGKVSAIFQADFIEHLAHMKFCGAFRNVTPPVSRRNLLNRHLKPTIKKLGLPNSVDFRSFRTMHSSLMSSIDVRPEVTRDNMGHATVDVTQNVYNRTWWEDPRR